MLIFLHIPFDSRRSLGFSRGVLWSRGRRRSGEIYCSSLRITMTMMMILILMMMMALHHHVWCIDRSLTWSWQPPLKIMSAVPFDDDVVDNDNVLIFFDDDL